MTNCRNANCHGVLPCELLLCLECTTPNLCLAKSFSFFQVPAKTQAVQRALLYQSYQKNHLPHQSTTLPHCPWVVSRHLTLPGNITCMLPCLIQFPSLRALEGRAWVLVHLMYPVSGCSINICLKTSSIQMLNKHLPNESSIQMLQ